MSDFEVTEAAINMIKKIYTSEVSLSFRVYMKPSRGCVEKLKLTWDILDEDGDIFFEKDNILFIINKNLLEKVKPITLDYKENGVNFMGFKIEFLKH